MKIESFRSDSADYTLYIHQIDPNRPYAIFLHGLGFNSHGERQVLAPFLHNQLNFIWFDLLGGAGSQAHAPEKISWNRQIDDLAQIIKQFAKGPVDILGHCIGTHLTHELVRKHRSLVRSAVWYSPTDSIADIFKGLIMRSLVEGRLDPRKLDESDRKALAHFSGTPAEGFGAEETRWILSMVAKIDGFQELYWSDPLAMDAYFKTMAEHPFAAEPFLRLQSEFFERKLGCLPVPSYEGIPVLMLHSENDGVVPWALHGRRLMDKIPHAKAQLVQGGSHWIHFQKPQECARQTLEFLASLPSQGL